MTEIKPEETPEMTPAETPETPPMRPLHSKMKEVYPDREFAGDEDYEGAAIEALEEALNLRKNTIAANQKLVDVFDMHPEVATFIKDIANGVPANVALARNFDLASIPPQEGSEDEEAWKAALSERQSKLENSRKLQSEIEANTAQSDAEIEAFATDRGMNDQEAQGFLEKVDQFVGEITKGKITKTFLDAMFKGMNYEEDLTAAREAGRVEGKNENIDGFKEKDNPELPPDIASASGEAKVAPQKRRFGQQDYS